MDQAQIIIIALTAFGIALLVVMVILLFPRMVADSEERKAIHHERDAIRKEWQEINDRLSAAESRWRGEVEQARNENLEYQENCRIRIMDMDNRLGKLIEQNRGLKNQIAEMTIDRAVEQKKNQGFGTRQNNADWPGAEIRTYYQE